MLVTSASANPTSKPKPRCATPKGWTVFGHNPQAVVIGRRGTATWDAGTPYAQPGYPAELGAYCLRSNGRFKQLFVVFLPSDPVTYFGNPKLSGVEFAYWVVQSYGPDLTNFYLHVWDIATGRESVYDDAGGDYQCRGSEFDGPYLLSPTGVAAWRKEWCWYPGVPPTAPLEAVVAYNATSHAFTTLDQVDQTSPRGTLANLQLYRCAAGCPDNSTVVAWTHDGSWRYARVA